MREEARGSEAYRACSVHLLGRLVCGLDEGRHVILLCHTLKVVTQTTHICVQKCQEQENKANKLCVHIPMPDARATHDLML